MVNAWQFKITPHICIHMEVTVHTKVEKSHFSLPAFLELHLKVNSYVVKILFLFTKFTLYSKYHKHTKMKQ